MPAQRRSSQRDIPSHTQASASAVLSCRCTPEQKAVLAAEAAQRGLTTASYLHQLVIARTRPKKLALPARGIHAGLRTISLSCRTRIQDRADIAALAREHDLSVARCVYSLIFLRKRPKPRQSQAADPGLARERRAATDFEAAGRELNGLARLANQTGQLPPALPACIARIAGLIDTHSDAIGVMRTHALFFQVAQIGKNLQQSRRHAEHTGHHPEGLAALAGRIEALVMRKIAREAA